MDIKYVHGPHMTPNATSVSVNFRGEWYRGCDLDAGGGGQPSHPGAAQGRFPVSHHVERDGLTSKFDHVFEDLVLIYLT